MKLCYNEIFFLRYNPLDLKSGNWQFSIKEKDIEKTQSQGIVSF